MLCQVCGAMDQYLFQPCGTFVAKEKEKGMSRCGTGKYYHCPKLVWTPPEDEITPYICDGCLRDGVHHFLRTAALWMDAQESAESISTIRNDHAARCGRAAPPPAPVDFAAFVNGMANSQDFMPMHILQSKADPSQQLMIKGFFPPFWSALPRKFRWFILNNCIPQSKLLDGVRGHNKSYAAYAIKQSLTEGEFAKHWTLRMASSKLRLLTVCIPCCTVCKTPYLDPEGGIKDVEIEPNLPSIDTLLLLAECEKSFQVNVQTAFIHKPCQRCIDNETKLRHRVYRFLSECCELEAWAVWNWLLIRGSGQVDFWNHEVMNTGVPKTEPPEPKKFLDLMAVGWKSKSGTAWENSIDVGPLGALLGTLQYHDRPLLSLSQWKKWAGNDDDPNSAMKLRILSSQSARPPAPGPGPSPSTSSAGEIRDGIDNPKLLVQGQQKRTDTPVKPVLKTRGHPNGFEANDQGLRRSSRNMRPRRPWFITPITPSQSRLNDPRTHISGGDSASNPILISDSDHNGVSDRGAASAIAGGAWRGPFIKREASNLASGAGSVIKRTRFELPGGQVTTTDEPVATQSKNDNLTSNNERSATSDWFACNKDFWHQQSTVDPCDKWCLPLGIDTDSSEDEDVMDMS